MWYIGTGPHRRAISRGRATVRATVTPRLRLRVQQLFPTCLQQLPILHTCRTHLFARTTTETTIDVRAKRVRRVLETSLSDGAHEVEPAAWSIILVAGDHVRWARLEAQPTVNAGEKLLFLSG